MTKQWADDILAIKPELDALAGRPVHIEPFNWFFSIGCRVGKGHKAVRIDKVKYKDPISGEWRVLDASFDTEADFAGLETASVTVEEAREALRDYVRSSVGKMN